MMKPIEASYIKFQLSAEQNPKTQIWTVITKEGDLPLGQIRWFGRWHKYAFFPDAQTVFETVCLTELKQFLDALMVARKFEGNVFLRRSGMAFAVKDIGGTTVPIQPDSLLYKVLESRGAFENKQS